MKPIRILMNAWSCVCILASVVLAADRMVGVVPTDGASILAKRFSVAAGTMITGVRFENNDGRTTYPEITLVRGSLTRLDEGTLVASAGHVQPGAGVVSVLWPTAVTAAETGTFYVAVRFPAGPGKQGAGQGPAIAAYDVATPIGTYVAGSTSDVLVPVRVDLALSLLTEGGTQKAGGAAPEPPDGAESARTESFVVRSQGGRLPVAIDFDLAKTSRVTINVYNVSGQLVRLIVDDPMAAGAHHVEWNGRDDLGRIVASGIYFVRFQHDGETKSMKVPIACR